MTHKSAGPRSTRPLWMVIAVALPFVFDGCAGVTSQQSLGAAWDAVGRGEYCEGERHFRTALNEARESKARQGGVLSELGRLYLQFEAYNSAEVALRDAISLLGEAYGTEGPARDYTVRYMLALTLAFAGKPVEAELMFRQALDAAERNHGPAEVSAVLAFLGLSLVEQKHIRPRVHGGTDDFRNLVTLCVPCHDYVEPDASTLG